MRWIHLLIGESLILTHPFHLAHFPAFAKNYPNVQYYGTPRHLRKFPDIKWAGDLFECATRSTWAPEIDIRIPAGMEFVRPLPEKTNHMCGLFVFHEASRTIHQNDTLMLGYHPNIILKVDGYRHHKMRFHKCITGPGLLPDPESPFVFKNWLLDIITDWDFDNVVAGHMGLMIGGAKAELQKLIIRSEPLFKTLHKKYKGKGAVHFVANGRYNLNLQADIFTGDTTCECG